MRLLGSVLLTSLLSLVVAQGFDAPGVQKETHGYQSDVTRLRKIVINSLYSHRDVFLRELISNANDAIEKLRLTALTDKTVYDGANPLNVTIKTIDDEQGGRIIISDTGIGMTAEELKTNLGTLARSGTSEFLAKAESEDGTGNGNLIGAFGLGFYSSFLVADKVYVASVPPATPANPNPIQYVFSSSSDDSSFEIFPDPRGNTLGRGTEITLFLKDDAAEYLHTEKLSELIAKHSSFSSTFPIYLFTQKSVEVPDDAAPAVEDTPAGEAPIDATKESVDTTKEPSDDEEAVIEDVSDSEPKVVEEVKPKTKTIVVDEWVQTNPQPPLWMRDPKDVTDEEYKLFYQATFKDEKEPLAWHHFSGDSGSGSSFRAILFVPSHIDESFWTNPPTSNNKDVRLMVKRVYITSEMGDQALPKWAGWVKVVVDADDLPLNVSRETLQSKRFLKQVKSVIMKRIIQLFERIAKDDPEKFEELSKVYGPIMKMGAVEDTKSREKLVALTRYPTNQRNATSFDEYLANKKQGQKQIFYLADMGKTVEFLQQSVFVEKLSARGYEVLLLTEPMDEVVLQYLRKWKGVSFQDVARDGLQFGDEQENATELAEYTKDQERFQPLLDYLHEQTKDIVHKVALSKRLVSSPCAIVADMMGHTANVERLMSAQQRIQKQATAFKDFTKTQRTLEINARSPLIEGLLRRINQLLAEGDEKDLEAEDEVNEVISILVDGALVRSGFEVTDSNVFFARVDRVLRRSLGVSETAEADTTVTPAPPVDPHVEEQPEDPELDILDSINGQTPMEVDEEVWASAEHDEL